MVRQMEIKWKGKEIFFPVEMKKKKTIKILVLNKKDKKQSLHCHHGTQQK